MYKKVEAEDLFTATDGNRNISVMKTPQAAMVNVPVADEPAKAYNQMSDAEAIRSMGDKLSKIWED